MLSNIATKNQVDNGTLWIYNRLRRGADTRVYQKSETIGSESGKPRRERVRWILEQNISLAVLGTAHDPQTTRFAGTL